MRYLFAMIFVLFSFSSFALEKGEMYRLPFGTHITILNEKGVGKW